MATKVFYRYIQYFSDLLRKTEIVEPSLERRVLCLGAQSAELPQ